MAEKKLTVRLWLGHWVSRWILFPLCYHVIRYRRKVVEKNLRLAFPDKTEAERKQIKRDFYLYFSDMLVEIVMGRNFSAPTMRQLVSLHQADEMGAKCVEYGGCFMMMGHFMNWEWTSALAEQLCVGGKECGIVYKRLNNAFFDGVMQRLRNKKGGFVIEMNQLLRVLVARRNSADFPPTYYAMLADQRPRTRVDAKQHWTTLLGQDVGMLLGTEQLATKFQYPVFYAYLHSSKRGFYEATFIQIYDPKEGVLPLGTITERFTRALEQNIKNEPARWLWSHNRFSRRRAK